MVGVALASMLLSIVWMMHGIVPNPSQTNPDTPIPPILSGFTENFEGAVPKGGGASVSATRNSGLAGV